MSGRRVNPDVTGVTDSHREACRRVLQRVMMTAKTPAETTQALRVTEAHGETWVAVYVAQTGLWAVINGDETPGPVLVTHELVPRVMCRWPDVELVDESEVLES